MINTVQNELAVKFLLNIPKGTVDAIYIDPPFNSGLRRERGDNSFNDEFEIVEYLNLIEELVIASLSALRNGGAFWLHCDESSNWRIRAALESNLNITFQNEVIWNYYNKMSNAKNKFASAADTIFLYSKKGGKFTFNPIFEKREKPVKQLLRKAEKGKMVNVKGLDGKCLTQIKTHRGINSVWRVPCLQPASSEWQNYPTQKPLELLNRVIESTTNPGDLFVDPMCGSGTAILAAKRLNRKFIGNDQSKQAVNISRNRVK